MQIQRIQTVWFILALIGAIVSLTSNWLKIGDVFVSIHNNIPLLILGLLATVLPLLAIFIYRNLRRQKLVGRLSALFAVITLGYVVALSYLGPDPEAELCVLGPVCMALSGIFDCLAVRAICHDEQLLRSADRLR